MKIMSVIASVMTALGSMGVSARTMSGFPGQSGAAAQRATQKAACERDARLIYRNSKSDLTQQAREQVKATRKVYVQNCLARAGFSP